MECHRSSVSRTVCPSTLLQVYNSSLTQYCSITISSQSGFPGHIGIFGSGPDSGFDDEQAAQKKAVERIAIRIVFIAGSLRVQFNLIEGNDRNPSVTIVLSDSRPRSGWNAISVIFIRVYILIHKHKHILRNTKPLKYILWLSGSYTIQMFGMNYLRIGLSVSETRFA